MTLLINQPDYVNLESSIKDFELIVSDLTMGTQVATLSMLSGVLSSTYLEQDSSVSENFLARVNVIALTQIIKNGKSIQVIFKNIGNIPNHPIEIGISGSVTNYFS